MNDTQLLSFQSNKSLLLEFMKEFNIKEIEVEYASYSQDDNTDIDDINLTLNDGTLIGYNEIASYINNKTFEFYPFATNEFFKVPDLTIEDFFQLYVFHFIETKYSGWTDEGGGKGYCFIEIIDEKLQTYCDHIDYYTETREKEFKDI